MPGAKVQGTAYALSGADEDITFDLNRQWEWFEVQVALPNAVQRRKAGFTGWFDELPKRQAFPEVWLDPQRPRVMLRLRVADATRLTLAPVYPGHPLILINPRFIRKK